MSLTESEYIWMDGELRPWNEATVHVGTHALHYGTGVFEGIRAYDTPAGTAIVRLTDHLRRFARSGGFYWMDLPYDTATLERATWELLDANDLDACYVRPIAWRGYRQLGVYPLDCPVQVAIMAWPWGAYLGEDSLEHGIKACISSWQRISARSLQPQAKASGQYLNSVLAKVQAEFDGYDEAILLNEAGLVAEASSENVFVVKDGRIRTPRVSDGILDGITRDVVMDICRTLGIDLEEGPVDRASLLACDELFLTGTAAEVTPVHTIDSTRIGEPGPVTRQVQQAFQDCVHGRDARFARHLQYAPGSAGAGSDAGAAGLAG